ncbi:hypothetical protein [Arcobacter porcinus]|uniref:Uncharacterized protein n=1 Tax=Arcobacter porcinus TaxID=1935204 RepID=A0ABX2YHP7_9BACT|nr:hypothetical protein [Arcobacter porcinus]OCL84120.1 hypothetical protein AAW30_00493 [Arcobacter porcinus]OCL89184.1 hypothetical protein AAX30_00321 [Arcobacter porcinus]OCL91604.1 hypothetical protein AAX28_01349 [Arcobacter porcinus]
MEIIKRIFLNFSVFIFPLFIIFGLLQIYTGFLGIQMYWGTIVAILALIFATGRGIFILPIAIGSYYYTSEVWGWHWSLSLLYIFPGIIYLGFILLSLIVVFINDKIKK